MGIEKNDCFSRKKLSVKCGEGGMKERIGYWPLAFSKQLIAKSLMVNYCAV